MVSCKSRNFLCNTVDTEKKSRDMDNIEKRNYVGRDIAFLDSTYPRSAERHRAAAISSGNTVASFSDGSEIRSSSNSSSCS